MLLGSGEVGAWQETFPQDLSDSPIQSQRRRSPQPRPDEQVTAADHVDVNSPINDLLAPQIIDNPLSSGRAVPGGELVDPDAARVLQKMIDEDEQLQLPQTVNVPLVKTLLPRIVPYSDPLAQVQHSAEIQRAHAPLTYGPLLEVDRRRLEPSLPTATGTFCPPGRAIDRFPTPPPANSPFSGALQNTIPYLPPLSAPPASDRRDVDPARRPSEEFLPPVTGQSSQRVLPIRQSSGIRQVGWHRSRSTR
ncbi:MAG: hypothetical protein ABGZ23_16905 [Fuerstiella sp.]|nr:hypothetical protein [Fuerstiella sp.]